MAVASTPLPPTFLQCPGEPTMPFGTWLKMFENYLLVIDVEGAKWPDTRIRATLLHSVGTEAQRIFYTLTETGTTYNHAVTALRAHFVPKVNVIAERHKFRQRAQRHDETIAQYVSALREMMVLCEFGNAEQDMLRDQIVEKAYSGRIRERLLLEDKLTLDKAIQIANQVETAVRNVAEFSNSEVPVREIRAPTWEQKLPAASKQRKGERKSEQARRCYRCDSDKHMANSTQCPATNNICKSCGKTGHFAKVCRSEQKREVREVVIPELTVLLLNNTAPKEKKIMCTVDLELSPANQSFEMIVDTGSSVSLLPAHVYETYFSHSSSQNSEELPYFQPSTWLMHTTSFHCMRTAEI
ncbi:uncharacterized protein LOC117535746 [Gymnodraco acuticeps]|uniref:Uncharacterized protein LOC117535746 n=1 Tax=Gymnodraco acuticeps TaxID=8218 RepID=A0A6P8SZB7_GYMAC|nr:uncharacterized protein LOC117535746 [Gymnodraco acuticeps]